MVDGAGTGEGLPKGIAPVENNVIPLTGRKVRSGLSIDQSLKDTPATITALPQRDEQEKMTLYKVEGEDSKGKSMLKSLGLKTKGTIKGKVLPYLAEYYADVIDPERHSSFTAFKEFVGEHPDATVYVKTTVKDQPRKHKYTITNSLSVSETGSKEKITGSSYAEAMEIDPDKKYDPLNLEDKKYDPNDPEAKRHNIQLFTNDLILTAIGRIEDIEEMYPGQRIIYIAPDNRIYNLSLQAHRDAFEQLGQDVLDKGAYAYRPAVE